jgi:CMP-2-keto-3-deoxyoctulosonic acid synthetase
MVLTIEFMELETKPLENLIELEEMPMLYMGYKIQLLEMPT